MHLTEQLNIRIDHKLRTESEQILEKLGIKTSDAVRMLLKQVCLTKSFPLELKIPNKKTLEAIKELENGGGQEMSINEFEDMVNKI